MHFVKFIALHIYGLCIFLYMVIFQLKSVKKKEKGEFTQIFSYSYFIFHKKLQIRREKRRKLVCESKRKQRKGEKMRNQRFYRKQQNRDTKGEQGLHPQLLL